MKVIGIFFVLLLSFAVYADTDRKAPALPIIKEDDNGVKEAAEVVGGILVGALSYHLSIKQCFDDSKDVFSHFKTAFENLKKETHSGVTTGLKELGQAMFKIPSAIKDCKDIKNAITKLQKLAVLFSNPTLLTVDVGKNIIWHFRSIIKEVRTAVSAYGRKEWFSFGMNIGIIADMVFLSNPAFASNFKNDGTDFLDGFAHGLNPAVYEDAKQCIGDVSPDVINQIIADIHELDWKHIERSVKAIQDIANIFVGIVKDCKSSSQSFMDFVQRLTHALDIGNFIDAALKIITNPLKFARMIENIKKDFDKHDFFDAGDVIGDFVGDVLQLHYTPIETLIKESF